MNRHIHTEVTSAFLLSDISDKKLIRRWETTNKRLWVGTQVYQIRWNDTK